MLRAVACVLFLLLLGSASAAQVSAVEGEFVLPNFPFHRQDTEWWCGEASLQMVLDYFSGKTIPQDLIASVARASEYAGTKSYDMRRALAFSRMSFPAAPNASVTWQATGYPGIDVGMATSSYSGQYSWLSELRIVLKKGIPVIVLQQFSFDDAGGHYRVVYGFNDTHVYMKDPWDRDGNPRDMKLSNGDFISLWRYVETASDGPSYTGIAAVPWTLESHSLGMSLSGSYMRFKLGFNYQDPFYQILPSIASHTNTPILELRYDLSIFNDTRTTLVNDLPIAEGSSYVSFQANCIAASLSTCQQASVIARISGITQGSVATAPKTETEVYPPYDYVDIIGSQWTKVALGGPQ